MFIGYRAVLLAALAVMLSMPVAAADFNIGYVQLKNTRSLSKQPDGHGDP